LKWVREEQECSWDEYTCCAAAKRGHLEVLQWAWEHGCPLTTRTCEAAARGDAVHVDPMEPKLKAPGYKLFKLAHEKSLLKFAFDCNLRHYNAAENWTF